MSKLPRMSGEELLKVLANRFDCKLIKRDGSHITMLNLSVRPPKLFSFPVHHELKQGTLMHAVEDSGVGRACFLEAVS